MYSVSSYGRMIADRARMDAYSRALSEAVKPGSVVLDIGTGIGIFAMLACRLGARRVYAIEPDNAIQVASEIADASGLAGRIEYIQDYSSRVTLPERANVIVSDMRGVLPLFQHHIPSIIDARERLLASDGLLIAQRDTLWVALVEDADLYDHHLRPWDDTSYGLNLTAARHIVANTWRKGRVGLEQLLVAPQRWGVLDYNTIKSPDVAADVTWTVERQATVHGLVVWFDTTLAPGVGFSNSPGETELIYGNGFFPLYKPVAVSSGDEVSVTLGAKLIGNDYIWRWDTRVLCQGQPDQVKASFKQSSFFGGTLSLDRLHKRAASYLPTLSSEGYIEAYILSLMNGNTPLGEIASHVMSRFPNDFATWQDALTRVGETSLKYSR